MNYAQMARTEYQAHMSTSSPGSAEEMPPFLPRREEVTLCFNIIIKDMADDHRRMFCDIQQY